MVQKPKEKFAIVLDFLPHGYPDDPRPFHLKEPIVQAIGKSYFTLLELVPQKNVTLKAHDEVYVGEGKRDKIAYIRGTIKTERLTQTAKNELVYAIAKLVEEQEERFVRFFNKAGLISLRAHQLELLPGIGKKHAKEIIAEREKRPFESFEDFRRRLPNLPDPKKLIAQRILAELERKDRYRLFVGAQN